MIERFSLPLSLQGLSTSEAEAFFALPWQKGTIDDLPLGEVSFILLHGRINDQHGNAINPMRGILGIKPFLRQKTERYVDRSSHLVAYVETKQLVTFFLRFPRAMQSYVTMEQHLGSYILSDFRHFSPLYVVSAEKACPESSHFGLALATRQARKEQRKTIYLEAANSGVSVFSLFEREATPALVQSQEGSSDLNLADLAKERIISLDDNIDVLNLHYLSVWKLTRDDWASLYWYLNERYSTIIVHTGVENPGFFADDARAVFNMVQAARDKPSLDRRMLSYDVYVPGAPELVDGIPIYPVGADGNGPLTLPHEIDQFDQFWNFIDVNFGRVLNPEKTYYLADSFNNPPGIVALLRKLAAGNSQKFHDFFKNNMVCIEGISAILVELAAVSPDWSEYLKVIKRIENTEFLKLFKPRYPRQALFTSKPVIRYLQNIFGNAGQQMTASTLVAYDYKNGQPSWLTSGSTVNNILLSAFPPGFLQRPTGLAATEIAASEPSYWLKQLAFFFRYGFKDIVFYHFANRVEGPKHMVSERLLLAHSNRPVQALLAGAHAQVVSIDSAKSQLSFWQNEENLFNQIDSTANAS